MSAVLLDGRALALAGEEALRQRILALPRPPQLAILRVGEDPASLVYVRNKRRTAERLGLRSLERALPSGASQAEVAAALDELKHDPLVDGIILQLPLPGGLQAPPLLERIDPDKDVDGLTPLSLGRLAQGRPGLVPCTPLGVLRLLEAGQIGLRGRRAVVVGRSNLVGRPMAMLLEQAGATVTLCHSGTRELPAEVARAELLVAALGRPAWIQAGWLAEGAVVVDVGIHPRPGGGLIGDVDLGPALERLSAVTPVPGGVGPMTVAMLMENTLRAAEARLRG